MIWFTGHGGVQLKVGLGDPGGLFQPDQFYDSMILGVCDMFVPFSLCAVG